MPVIDTQQYVKKKVLSESQKRTISTSCLESNVDHVSHVKRWVS